MAVQDDHMIRNIQDVGRLIAKLLLHEQQPAYTLPENEALTFYLYLNDMDGDFLDDNGYSREEVLEGMKDLASDWGVSGIEAF